MCICMVCTSHSRSVSEPWARLRSRVEAVKAVWRLLRRVGVTRCLPLVACLLFSNRNDMVVFLHRLTSVCVNKLLRPHKRRVAPVSLCKDFRVRSGQGQKKSVCKR